MATPNELEPTFVVQVRLDGDDDAQIQTENARLAIDAALVHMKADGLIRDYTLTPPFAIDGPLAASLTEPPE